MSNAVTDALNPKSNLAICPSGKKIIINIPNNILNISTLVLLPKEALP